VRECVVKHKRPFEGPVYAPYRPSEAPLLEAQIVDMADGIAYNSHDLDDGIHSGILDPDGLGDTKLWSDVRRAVLDRWPKLSGKDLIRRIVAGVIDHLVKDLVRTTAATLKAHGVRTLADVRRATVPARRAEPEAARAEAELKAYLYEHFYTHHRVARMRHRARVLRRRAVRSLRRDAHSSASRFRALAETDGLHRAVADYISGMTDAYVVRAIRETLPTRGSRPLTALPGRPSDDVLSACEAALRHEFRDRDLLAAALTHASAKLEAGRSNERRVLSAMPSCGLLVSEALFAGRPSDDEGAMTRARAELVSRKALASVGRALELERFVMTGKMFATPRDIADSVLSNAVEAVLAAVWLDGGYEAARRFVSDFVIRELPSEAREDWKGRLARWVQAGHASSMPRYDVLSVAGDDHCRTFEVCVVVDKRRFAPGYGRSKKDAEQRAARQAVKALGVV
jgi:dsRNA-specific ribonuclease